MVILSHQKKKTLVIPIIEAMYFTIVYQQNIQKWKRIMSHFINCGCRLSTFLCIGFGHSVRSCWAIEWKKAVQIYIEYYLIRNSDSLHTFTYQFFLLWMENLKGNIGAWKWEKVKVIHYLFLHAWPQSFFFCYHSSFFPSKKHGQFGS